MTITQIIADLSKVESIKPFQTVRVGYVEVYRGQENPSTYSISLNNTQVGGGRIPAKADPATFPLAMAKAILAQMK